MSAPRGISRLSALTLLVAFLSITGAGRADAARVDHLCTPVQVAVWVTEPRLHVRCSAAVGGIIYFAIRTDLDTTLAARVLSILSTAQVAGRTLLITYDTTDTTTGPAFGCLAHDCRPIQAVSFGQ